MNYSCKYHKSKSQMIGPNNKEMIGPIGICYKPTIAPWTKILNKKT